MSDYRATINGSNRDFRDQFRNVAEFKEAMAKQPKVPSLIPNRNSYGKNQGLNRAPSYSRYREPRRNHRGYNTGKFKSIDKPELIIIEKPF